MQRLKENKRIYTSEPDYDWAKQSLIERRQEDGEPIEDITDEKHTPLQKCVLTTNVRTLIKI